MTRRDWSRCLLATEIVWASDLIGSGHDWPITTCLTDHETLDLLRGLHRPSCPERGRCAWSSAPSDGGRSHRTRATSPGQSSYIRRPGARHQFSVASSRSERPTTGERCVGPDLGRLVAVTGVDGIVGSKRRGPAAGTAPERAADRCLPQ